MGESESKVDEAAAAALHDMMDSVQEAVMLYARQLMTLGRDSDDAKHCAFQGLGLIVGHMEIGLSLSGADREARDFLLSDARQTGFAEMLACKPDDVVVSEKEMMALREESELWALNNEQWRERLEAEDGDAA